MGRAILGGSFATAKRGRAACPTGEGKATRWILTTDNNGLPLAVLLDRLRRNSPSGMGTRELPRASRLGPNNR
jgi:hypothetical protein